MWSCTGVCHPKYAGGKPRGGLKKSEGVWPVQVYRHYQNGYWRASKRWCKQLPQDAVSKALVRFADNEAGLCPAAIYGGSRGAIAQLKRLEEWFQVHALDNPSLALTADCCFQACWLFLDYGSV